MAVLKKQNIDVWDNLKKYEVILCRKEKHDTAVLSLSGPAGAVGCVRYAPACIHAYSLQSIGTYPNCHSDESGQ